MINQMMTENFAETAEAERKAILDMLKKKIEACLYYAKDADYPPTRKQWEADADLYQSIHNKIHKGEHNR